MTLWEEWEEVLRNDGEAAADLFYAIRQEEMNAGAVVSWQARPLVTLMKIRARDGHDTFDSEYQNDPVAGDNAPFAGVLTFWVNRLPTWLFYGAIDPSLGKQGASRDPSALLVGGFNRETGVLDVVEAAIKKRLPDRIIEDAIAYQRQYRCLLWAVETVQFQAFLYTELVKRAAVAGIPFPAVAVQPITDKLLRIESLQPHMANGLIRVHDARAIMPLEMTLEVQKITGGTGGNETPHLALVDWAERSESKLIVGQTMSAESKASGIGSGNAELHREVRHDILMADARQIAGTLTRDLLYPLVALNRGKVDGLARCPRFVFDTGEAEDVKQMSEAWPKLVGVGMEIPLEYAHQKLKIPMPKAEEKILTIASPPNVLEPALRPEPGKATPDQDRKRQAETALSARFDERSAVERDAFEELADQMGDDWEPTIGQMLAPVRQLIDECATLEGFRARMPEVIERMNITALQGRLAESLFAAHLAGRVIPGKSR